MKPMPRGLITGAAVAACVGGLLLLATRTFYAQQMQGVSGSASATKSLDTKTLPPPAPKFGGVINLNAAQSKPWWPPRVVPPKGRPTCC